MSKLFLRSFRLNITVPVGPISEKKVQKIQQVLGEEFPLATGVDNVSTMLVNPTKQAVLLFAPQQVTFGLDGENVNPDFEYMKSTIYVAIEALLVDPIGKAGIHIVGNYPYYKSSMDDSFKFLSIPKKELQAGLAGLKGVGLRFLIDRGEDTWEYKVEPLIKNPNFYFLEAICGITKDLPLDDIIKIAEEAYTYFIGDWRTIAEESLIGRG